MSIQKEQRIMVYWTDEERIAILLAFSRNWQWDDMYLAQGTANRMMMEVSNVVDLIYDFRNVYTLPKGFFTHLQRVATSYPPNAGMVLLVGANRVIMAMVRSLTLSYPDLARQFAFVDTLEEALIVAGP